MGRCLTLGGSFRRIYCRRGDVHLANASFAGEIRNEYSEKESNRRYVVVVQAGARFQNSRTVVVMNITTQGLDSVGKNPTDVFIGPAESGTRGGAKNVASQPYTIRKDQLIRYMYRLGSETLRKLDEAIAISMGLAA